MQLDAACGLNLDLDCVSTLIMVRTCSKLQYTHCLYRDSEIPTVRTSVSNCFRSPHRRNRIRVLFLIVVHAVSYTPAVLLQSELMLYQCLPMPQCVNEPVGTYEKVQKERADALMLEVGLQTSQWKNMTEAAWNDLFKSKQYKLVNNVMLKGSGKNWHSTRDVFVREQFAWLGGLRRLTRCIGCGRASKGDGVD